jgi:hypothetical protein
MSKEGKATILQAAAKVLAWELYAASGYGRTRTRISVEKFDFLVGDVWAERVNGRWRVHRADGPAGCFGPYPGNCVRGASRAG